jgi:hypothetical protein
LIRTSLSSCETKRKSLSQSLSHSSGRDFKQYFKFFVSFLVREVKLLWIFVKIISVLSFQVNWKPLHCLANCKQGNKSSISELLPLYFSLVLCYLEKWTSPSRRGCSGPTTAPRRVRSCETCSDPTPGSRVVRGRLGPPSEATFLGPTLRNLRTCFRDSRPVDL